MVTRGQTTAEPTLTIANGYVAFLDILGFTALLKKQDYEKIIGRVVQTLQKRVNYDSKHTTGLRYLAISDTIIITADEGKGWALVRKIAQVQTALLRQGFAVRGAISYGPVLTYDGNNMGRNIFGSTYLAAYKGEQKLAVYPRVVTADEDVADQIWDDIKEGTERKVATYMIKDKNDGLWFVNQFSSQLIGRNSKTKENRDDAELLRAEFAEQIKKNLSETRKDPRANMKWRWLQRQLDAVLPPLEA